ncbi:putative Transitional endoplasmic reticulum ATPase [Histomonas meleagridis]|uniref:putative Transitional endoplasmic reticulum ATPase n=1 Tax=Histomonas meleagridis TaxID=135588 RepID=UPI003559584D|nr:putative Transitional endoplasmic reticulum ATPase [Histomonas meleagridis]KAH0797134.1 putative Transitional endoplasmic reticulum ATPase [Histomonas meleagridis]
MCDFFSVSCVSLPLNFVVLLNSKSIKKIGLKKNGYALIKGKNEQISIFKVIKDSECKPYEIKVPLSAQITLGLSPKDEIPILPFDGEDHCDAIKVAPLFRSHRKEEFKSQVIDFFTQTSQPVTIDSIFLLKIGNQEKPFKIISSLPTDRSFTSSTTKLYFTPEPGPILDSPIIPQIFSNLTYDETTKDFINSYIFNQYKYPRLLAQMRINTSIGILVYGESGSGKTSLLSSISTSLKCPSIYCDCHQLKSLKIEEFYENINKVFDFYTDHPPCLIMVDNLQEIVIKLKNAKTIEDRKKTVYLLEKVENCLKKAGVILIGTIESLDDIDKRFLRDGRFGYEVELKQPSTKETKELIKNYTSGMFITEEDLNEIVSKFANTMTTKEIMELCRESVSNLVEDVTGSHGMHVSDRLMADALGTKMHPIDFGIKTKKDK